MFQEFRIIFHIPIQFFCDRSSNFGKRPQIKYVRKQTPLKKKLQKIGVLRGGDCPKFQSSPSKIIYFSMTVSTMGLQQMYLGIKKILGIQKSILNSNPK